MILVLPKGVMHSRVWRQFQPLVAIEEIKSLMSLGSAKIALMTLTQLLKVVEETGRRAWAT
jgi:hypothetical protein